MGLRKKVRKEAIIILCVCAAILIYVLWRILSVVLYHSNNSFIDINGEADYSLATLTLEDILDEWYGYTMFASGSYGEGDSTNVDHEWEDEDRDSRSIHAKSFSGVTVLQATKTDCETLTLNVTSTVESGNFRIVITVDGAYYGDVEINKTTQVVLNDIQNKTVLIKLAGESAKFRAEVSRTYE